MALVILRDHVRYIILLHPLDENSTVMKIYDNKIIVISTIVGFSLNGREKIMYLI